MCLRSDKWLGDDIFKNTFTMLFSLAQAERILISNAGEWGGVWSLSIKLHCNLKEYEEEFIHCPGQLSAANIKMNGEHQGR